MEKDKKTIEIPAWEKYALTIYEAAEYFGIGEHHLRENEVSKRQVKQGYTVSPSEIPTMKPIE